MLFGYDANSFSTEKTLKITSTPHTFRSTLHTNDIYNFSLSGRSSFNLVVNGLSANANVKLVNSNGSVIAQSSGSRSADISTNLDAGSYRIQVNRVGRGNSYYSLKVSGNETPQSLQFGTDKSSYQLGQSVSLTNASVFDGNGAADLARVDFWLQKDNGSLQDISDAVNFTASSSDNRRNSFNYSLTGLDTGNYQLWAKAYDKSGASTDSVQAAFKVVPSMNWFNQNIQDAGIRGTAISRFEDNVLDRNDMIAILREAKDGGVVDATEVTDLRALVNNGLQLGMPDYVRVLSNKIVNGDTANQKYQGSTLGNLSAGSSDTQMEKLIGKWFLGSDRPTTSYTYQHASGSLFQNGVSYSDIKQGEINDCFLLTGLAATALRSPSTIESMFVDNNDGTFTVRFYKNKVADYVTVDKYLPTNSSGYFVYAKGGGSYNSSSNELWVALAEKAYAQLNESGWIYQDNTNSYKGINNGGYMSDAFAHITGRSTTFGNGLDFNSIVNTFNTGELIGLGTKSTNIASNLLANHAYTLVNYNSDNQIFTLFNPWGVNNGSAKPGILELTWNQLAANFSYWDSTTNPIIPT